MYFQKMYEAQLRHLRHRPEEVEQILQGTFDLKAMFESPTLDGLKALAAECAARMLECPRVLALPDEQTSHMPGVTFTRNDSSRLRPAADLAKRARDCYALGMLFSGLPNPSQL
jgi:hypothetical protein